MKLASWPIIFLLVFALLVQNTCLHGFAGKTSFTGKRSHCPSATSKFGVPHVSKYLLSDHQISVNSPMYFFTVPTANQAVHPERRRTLPPTLLIDYMDALPDELLKPPRT